MEYKLCSSNEYKKLEESISSNIDDIYVSSNDDHDNIKNSKSDSLKDHNNIQTLPCKQYDNNSEIQYDPEKQNVIEELGITGAENGLFSDLIHSLVEKKIKTKNQSNSSEHKSSHSIDKFVEESIDKFVEESIADKITDNLNKQQVLNSNYSKYNSSHFIDKFVEESIADKITDNLNKQQVLNSNYSKYNSSHFIDKFVEESIADKITDNLNQQQNQQYDSPKTQSANLINHSYACVNEDKIDMIIENFHKEIPFKEMPFMESSKNFGGFIDEMYFGEPYSKQFNSVNPYFPNDDSDNETKHTSRREKRKFVKQVSTMTFSSAVILGCLWVSSQLS